METDILGGVQMGYRTVLVLSGGTRQENVGHHPYRPDLIIESVAALCHPSIRLEDVLPRGDLADDSVPVAYIHYAQG